MKKDETKCLSCNKVIKSHNLERHSKAKLHLKNVEKKVDAMKRNTPTKEEEINKQSTSDIFRNFIRTNHLTAKWELYLKENNIDLTKTKEVKRKNNSVKHSYLEEVFPICISKDGYTINLAGMKKLSPTGDNWGYAPLRKAYKTQKEAEEVRKELWKTISRWVNNNK